MKERVNETGFGRRYEDGVLYWGLCSLARVWRSESRDPGRPAWCHPPTARLRISTQRCSRPGHKTRPAASSLYNSSTPLYCPAAILICPAPLPRPGLLSRPGLSCVPWPGCTQPARSRGPGWRPGRPLPQYRWSHRKTEHEHLGTETKV